MDTPASLTPKTLATFEASPEFCLSEYVTPCRGWRTFNEFFARHFQRGYRPIAAVEDSSIIVISAGITLHRQLEISPLSTLIAKGVHGVLGG